RLPRQLEHALRAVEAQDLRRGRAEVEPDVDGHVAVLEEDRVDVRHVAAVLEAPDAARRHRPPRRLVLAPGEEHAADEVDHEVAGHARPELLPAAPAREQLGVEGTLRRAAEPGVPVQVRGREVGRGRVLPRAVRVVPAHRALDELYLAEDALLHERAGLGADHRARALRADLDEAAALLGRRHHLEAVGRRVGHRLLAVDVLPSRDRVHHDLLVPVVGHRGHDAVDLLVREQLLVAPCGPEVLLDDLAREGVAAVVEVAGGRALDTGEGDRGVQEAGALHADPDDAEADAVARGHGTRPRLEVLGGERDRLPSRSGGPGRDRGADADLEELAAGGSLHRGLLSYFLRASSVTFLKKTMSSLLWFWRPIQPSAGRGPRWGSKSNLRSGTGWPSV